MNKGVLLVGLLIAVPLIVLFAGSFGSDPHSIPSPLIGREAPPLELKALSDAKPVALTTLRGKPVVLNFWATWCEPCQVEHQVLQQGARLLGQKVQFIGVVYDDEPARIQRFLDQHGSGYPTLIDKEGKAAIAYGVHGVPETFFIDARGQLVSKHEGPLDFPTLAALVQPLLEAP